MLVASTMAAMLWLMAMALAPGGIGTLDLMILALFALTLPWIVVGFWNAAIGFLLLRFSPDPVAAVFPDAARIRGDEPIVASTAILVCIRNEEPLRVAQNLAPLIAGLEASGVADRFRLYILSDTEAGLPAEREQEIFASLCTKDRALILRYRRRASNDGFKAGNIADFCRHWGAEHDFAVVLDADSIMPADAVLRLVRIMQAQPSLGILQGFVVGLPSTSAFARVFQFGMRLGMRSYTIGSAWWQGDCGPYWGHNAILRLAPFIAHCALPELPDGSAVLSHDQIEAVLMRRAGFAVRVLPEEDLGWEQNPPTLVEFMRRDLRWCQGNMQYWSLLRMPGLAPVSRFQLAFAIIMFVGSPGWIGLLALGTFALVTAPSVADVIAPVPALAVFWLVLAMWYAPKIATIVDVLLRADARGSFGGATRFIAGVVAEAVFFMMLSQIMWFSHTLYLAGLPFGRAASWGGQRRDNHRVGIAVAARAFWRPTVFGGAILLALAFTHPGAIPFALVFCGGLAAAIPFAVITSSSRIGKVLVRIGVGRLPEETAPPLVLRVLAVPAVELSSPPVRTCTA